LMRRDGCQARGGTRQTLWTFPSFSGRLFSFPFHHRAARGGTLQRSGLNPNGPRQLCSGAPQRRDCCWCEDARGRRSHHPGGGVTTPEESPRRGSFCVRPSRLPFCRHGRARRGSAALRRQDVPVSTERMSYLGDRGRFFLSLATVNENPCIFICLYNRTHVPPDNGGAPLLRCPCRRPCRTHCARSLSLVTWPMGYVSLK